MLSYTHAFLIVREIIPLINSERGALDAREMLAVDLSYIKKSISL